MCLQCNLDKIEPSRTRILPRLNAETFQLMQENISPRCNCPLNNTPISYNHFKGRNFILPFVIITKSEGQFESGKLYVSSVLWELQ